VKEKQRKAKKKKKIRTRLKSEKVFKKYKLVTAVLSFAVKCNRFSLASGKLMNTTQKINA